MNAILSLFKVSFEVRENMGKKSSDKAKRKQNIIDETPKSDEYSPRVEKIYKIMLRSMSWIVGISFVAVLLLPQFNDEYVDKVTKIIYLIGISTLLVFLVIELIGDSLKNLINKLVETTTDGHA